ncbi:MAG: hypothetical protein D4R67_09515 [Bacteroidetes bacterium]|nr:MAG: hypothetical protein D4R67_09515 [Bacteroidota bacterium]
MKLDITKYAISLAFIVSLTACQSRSTKKVENLAPNAHQVVAEEVILTSRYTYVLVSADENEYWVAIPKANIIEGNTYFWSVGSEINNFTSTELNRTFPSIFFVQDFTDQPILSGNENVPLTMGGKLPSAEKPGISVEKAEGGITIAELFSDPAAYSGKTVKINGEVVKFLPEIINRNWVHLQDGTRDGDNFDLTVTTDAFVNVGDVVTFEGIVAIDKDFGAGYFYPVIVEEAVVK